MFGLAMHPSQDLLALGLVDGRALLYSYEGMGEACTLRTALRYVRAGRNRTGRPNRSTLLTRRESKCMTMQLPRGSLPRRGLPPGGPHALHGLLGQVRESTAAGVGLVDTHKG